MGDETRQITNKLEDVIRSMADKVGDIAITQATICTKQDNMHEDVKETQVNVKKINGRVNSLESTRDKNRGMAKVWGWVAVFVIGLPGLAWGIIKVVEWAKS